MGHNAIWPDAMGLSSQVLFSYKRQSIGSDVPFDSGISCVFIEEKLQSHGAEYVPLEPPAGKKNRGYADGCFTKSGENPIRPQAVLRVPRPSFLSGFPSFASIAVKKKQAALRSSGGEAFEGKPEREGSLREGKIRLGPDGVFPSLSTNQSSAYSPALSFCRGSRGYSPWLCNFLKLIPNTLEDLRVHRSRGQTTFQTGDYLQCR